MSKKIKVNTIKGFEELTEDLIRGSLGKEEPEKLLKWISDLSLTPASMKFDPFHPKGEYVKPKDFNGNASYGEEIKGKKK